MDELERVRRLADEAPAPDPGRKAEARGRLLDLAERDLAERDLAERELAERELAERDVVGARRRPAVGRSGILAAAAVLVLLVGVGALLLDTVSQTEAPDDPGELRGAGTPEGLDVDLAASCAGPEGRYEVRYPAGWHTDPDGCKIFAEEPVEEAVGGGGLGLVVIEVVPLALDEITGPSGTVRVLAAEDTTVDERPAVRRLEESTGEGALPEGVRRYAYYVDLGDAVLVASTDAADAADAAGAAEGTEFAERRRILDAMMAALRTRDG